MAKQKIVVKFTMTSDKKSRKALKIAVSVSGVESVSFVGSNKDQIAVTGEGIDSIELAKLLRKGVGHTELVSVGPATSGGAVASQAVVPLILSVITTDYRILNMKAPITTIPFATSCEISSSETE